ncbi:hypothetical protein GIB67_004948, partial [Kingdonia uniflora]
LTKTVDDCTVDYLHVYPISVILLNNLIACFTLFSLKSPLSKVLKITKSGSNPLLKMFPTKANPKSSLPIWQKQFISVLSVTTLSLISSEAIVLNIMITVEYCLNLHMTPNS